MNNEITYNNFEISLVVFMSNITTNHATTYTNSLKYNFFFAVSGGSWKLHVSQTSYEMDRKLSQGKLERRGSHSIFFERQVNCRLYYQPLFGKISPVKKRLIVKLISRNFKQLDTLPYEEFICHETTVGYDRDYTFLEK